MKSLYLINPRPLNSGYFGSSHFEKYGSTPVMWLADVAAPTVAAFAPPTLKVSICEEHVEPVDLERDADYIGLTGSISQWERTCELAAAFRARGRTVIIGGSYATLSPDTVRPHCDVLVRGELESIADELFADLENGQPKAEYVASGPADLTRSPIPRWDLYPNDRVAFGGLQTSRGCPYSCEFCDVIAYQGREQRHKTVRQVLDELDALYRCGYRTIFLNDDNLTAHRRRIKGLLREIEQWNRAQRDGHVEFFTQISIDAARDEELVQLCAEAGMVGVLVGVETPNEESLRECGKRQNLGGMMEGLELLARLGISVTGTFIAGFDSDTPAIFEQILAFCQRSPVVFCILSALVAPERTPLHQRLEAEGRLRSGEEIFPGCPWSSNVVPANMTIEQRLAGFKWLASNLYAPERYAERFENFVRLMEPPSATRLFAAAVGDATATMRPAVRDRGRILTQILKFGPSERDMYNRMLRAAREKPWAKRYTAGMLNNYMQARVLFEDGGMWDPTLVGRPFKW